jgi:hypothetical protein
VPHQAIRTCPGFRRLLGLLANCRNRQPRQQAACQHESGSRCEIPAAVTNKTKDLRFVVSASAASAIKHVLTSFNGDSVLIVIHQLWLI